jgi:hypothetical protein
MGFLQASISLIGPQILPFALALKKAIERLEKISKKLDMCDGLEFRPMFEKLSRSLFLSGARS